MATSTIFIQKVDEIDTWNLAKRGALNSYSSRTDFPGTNTILPMFRVTKKKRFLNNFDQIVHADSEEEEHDGEVVGVREGVDGHGANGDEGIALEIV
jgi:hypothetical protein